MHLSSASSASIIVISKRSHASVISIISKHHRHQQAFSCICSCAHVTRKLSQQA
jgi:hypothetical protein